MPQGATYEMDGRELMHKVTVRVRMKHINEMRIRAWVGGRLLHLGAWIAGCELDFPDEEELRKNQYAHDIRQMRRRILRRRVGLGLSQQALADRASISRNYVSLIERGKATNLSIRIVDQLATALDTTPAYLMGYSVEQAVPK